VHVRRVSVGDVDGGVLFDWYVADIGGFTRMFNRLSDWVHYVAALVEQVRIYAVTATADRGC
jgi:hypothetical protein